MDPEHAAVYGVLDEQKDAGAWSAPVQDTHKFAQAQRALREAVGAEGLADLQQVVDVGLAWLVHRQECPRAWQHQAWRRPDGPPVLDHRRRHRVWVWRGDTPLSVWHHVGALVQWTRLGLLREVDEIWAEHYAVPLLWLVRAHWAALRDAPPVEDLYAWVVAPLARLLARPEAEWHDLWAQELTDAQLTHRPWHVDDDQVPRTFAAVYARPDRGDGLSVYRDVHLARDTLGEAWTRVWQQQQVAPQAPPARQGQLTIWSALLVRLPAWSKHWAVPSVCVSYAAGQRWPRYQPSHTDPPVVADPTRVASLLEWAALVHHGVRHGQAGPALDLAVYDVHDTDGQPDAERRRVGELYGRRRPGPVQHVRDWVAALGHGYRVAHRVEGGARGRCPPLPRAVWACAPPTTGVVPAPDVWPRWLCGGACGATTTSTPTAPAMRAPA